MPVVAMPSITRRWKNRKIRKIGIKERIDIANSAPQSVATLAEGRSVASIAADFGVSRQTIARVREAAAASIG
jgi:hypothetical protein